MNPLVSCSQLTLDFQPGLTERHETLVDCVRAGIYRDGRPLKTIAADMGLAPSDLSRKLAENPDDSRRFTAEDLVRYIAVTGDLTPIQWLAEKFCIDAQVKRDAALATLAQLTPQIQALIKTAGG